MEHRNSARHIVAELTRGITKSDVDAVRRKAGLDPLQDGSLGPALAEFGLSIEDLMTLLMAALVEKSAEAKKQAVSIERFFLLRTRRPPFSVTWFISNQSAKMPDKS